MKLVDGIYHVDKRFKFAAYKTEILAWPWYRIHQINQPIIIKLINVKQAETDGYYCEMKVLQGDNTRMTKHKQYSKSKPSITTLRSINTSRIYLKDEIVDILKPFEFDIKNFDKYFNASTEWMTDQF